MTRNSRRLEGVAFTRFRLGGEEFMVFSIRHKEEAPADLTEAEASVLAAVLEGRSNREIAEARRTSAGTIANQLTSIMRKLRARSRSELARVSAGVAPNRKGGR